ncbi:MAG TPA: membrane protein insertase YidC [Polyangia bacterium]|jgi:YidC/Oxa1 family membrane protein insertase|nr:membrane protein insertase YidC [Polyangia bacterium]
MEKRVVIAIVICVGILFAWMKIFPPPTAPTPAPRADKSSPSIAPAGTAPSSVPAPGPAAAAGGAGAEVAAADHPEELVELITPAVRFVLSSHGGTLRQAQLRAPKYLMRKGDPSSGLELITTSASGFSPLRTEFPKAGFARPSDGAWTVTRPAADTVAFEFVSDAVRIEKKYRAEPESYRLLLDVTVENKTDKPVDHDLGLHIYGHQNPDQKGGSFLSGSSANPASVICEVGEKAERRSVEKVAKERLEKGGNVLWAGTDDKFFLLAAVPFPESPPRERTCAGTSPAPDIGDVFLLFGERTVAPHASTTYPFIVFAGPKIREDLEKVSPNGEDARLHEAIDVNLAFLSRPILSLLKFFQSFVGNWGLAIILLTVFIRLLTFYPTQRSLLSAKKMQKLAPKMAAIRKKYENDKQRQSVETMNLYKAHGVSPFGGCLPSLIQMPIWIALYSTLNYAVELYRSPFILHIHDLTAKDPYYITPLLMGGVMFAQMRMSPASPDQQQQQMMALMMPIMFTAFSLVLPAGLALYMLTSYLIGILQQLYVNHVDRKASAIV